VDSMARVLVAIFMLAACNRGNNYMDPGELDLAETGDLAESTGPDLHMAGPSCGQIATCAFGCGQDFACIGMCAQGADPQTLAALGGLLLCAGTNCISFNADGGGLGGIDMTQLFMCLFQKCGPQLSMCGGFGF
jgi:hypothetical protein